MNKCISSIIVVIIILSLTSCNLSNKPNTTKDIPSPSLEIINQIKNPQTPSSTPATSSNPHLKYQAFVNYITTFKQNFTPTNFLNANTQGPIPLQIVVFPNDIKLDTRTNDGIEGDPMRPTKYPLYYLSKDKTALIKLSFVYAQTETSGILFHSIISPERTIGMDEKYHSSKRPFSITTILSLKDYLIVFESYLTDPDSIQATDEEKIMKLINIANDFYKSVEAYLIEQDKNNK